MIGDFKAFVLRGNVVDLAVGVIVGGAFGKIVTSLVNDVVMPPVGLLLGGVDASNLFIELGSGHHATLAEAKKAGAATLNYGLFMNAVLDFLIVSAVIFLAIRMIARLQKPQVPPVTTRDCPLCKMPIPLAATRCGHCTAEVAAT